MSSTTTITITGHATSTASTSGTIDLNVANGAGTQDTLYIGENITVDIAAVTPADSHVTTDIGQGATEIIGTGLGNDGNNLTFNLGLTPPSSITGGGTLELTNPNWASSFHDEPQINFYGTDDELIFDNHLTSVTVNDTGTLGTTDGTFKAGDSIVLTGVTTATQAVWTQNTNNKSDPETGGTITLENAAGHAVGTIVLDAGSFGSNQTFDVATLANNGGIVVTVPCFAAGTTILTTRGPVAVEALAVGDTVVTMRSPKATERKIVWIGSRRVDVLRHPRPETVRPVRIRADAFGPGQPQRDLRVSPDHALFLDGHLIEAKNLVNGVTVIEEQSTRLVTYYHVELDAHDILLAEGLPAESFLDCGNRSSFARTDGALVLHPDFATRRDRLGCAPLASEGRIVQRARRALLARAGLLGFHTTDALDVTLMAGGRRLLPVLDETRKTLTVDLPKGCDAIELVAATGSPGEVGEIHTDRRRLGLAVVAIDIAEPAGTAAAIPATALPDDGFHPVEQDDKGAYRWSRDHALIRLPRSAAKRRLVITFRGQATRWDRQESGNRRYN